MQTKYIDNIYLLRYICIIYVLSMYYLITLAGISMEFLYRFLRATYHCLQCITQMQSIVGQLLLWLYLFHPTTYNEGCLKLDTLY